MEPGPSTNDPTNEMIRRTLAQVQAARAMPLSCTHFDKRRFGAELRRPARARQDNQPTAPIAIIKAVSEINCPQAMAMFTGILRSQNQTCRRRREQPNDPPMYVNRQ